MDYKQFLLNKRIVVPSSGIDVDLNEINDQGFDFQRDIVRWSLAKGKAAIFAGTGLGKTFQQLEWANQLCKRTGGNVLILAPLAVSMQTVGEGLKFGITVHICRTQDDVSPGINITNYEMMEHFDPDYFIGVVLDESSILKAQTGKTRTAIIEKFMHTPYKLACTATPAPNDHMELGNHAEFLGVMSATEMLSMFFVHDGGDTSKWRLKGHAVKRFWEWVASWAVMMTKPQDLGYNDDRYQLPPLNIQQIVVKVDNPTETLFAVEAQTLQERQQARRDSLEERVKVCAELVNNSNDPWLIWCNLNNESEALTKSINGAVEVKGSDSSAHKEWAMTGFAKGEVMKLVTKPSIAGFGMNWQHCSNMAFVGLSDSFEEYYQAVRRCWRFGQTKPVNVYVITAETEGAVVANIERKERDFTAMLQGMISATQEITKKNIRQTVNEKEEYNPKVSMTLPNWIGGTA